MTDYQILVNKDHELEKSYYETVILPSIVEVEAFKNNEIVYKSFGIKDCKTYLEKKTAQEFANLRNYALENGITLGITSGFLTFEQQKIKYDYFVKKKGKEFAEKSACVPGFSEHNTGLAMDVDIFKDSRWAGIAVKPDGSINEETKKLHGMLHKFGFILRYPKGKEDITKMKFEPWHIRYVGRKIAKFIFEKNLTLEEYTNNFRSDFI